MKKEIDSGVTSYREIYTDNERLTWNLIQRGDKSICIYATRPGYSGHLVIFDTLDNKTPGDKANEVISHLKFLAEYGELLRAY